jgi:hypothetical protein
MPNHTIRHDKIYFSIHNIMDTRHMNESISVSPICFDNFHDDCSEDNSRDRELNRYYSLKVCHRLEQIG